MSISQNTATQTQMLSEMAEALALKFTYSHTTQSSTAVPLVTLQLFRPGAIHQDQYETTAGKQRISSDPVKILTCPGLSSVSVICLSTGCGSLPEN